MCIFVYVSKILLADIWGIHKSIFQCMQDLLTEKGPAGVCNCANDEGTNSTWRG